MKIGKFINAKTLTGAAVIGVFVTAIFVAKETPKAKEAFEEEFKDYTPDKQTLKVSAQKIARVAWQYKGAIISGVTTIGCIVGAQKLNTEEILKLTATVGYLAANRDKAEQYILDHDDEDAYGNYEYDKNTDPNLRNFPGKEKGRKLPVEDTGLGDTLFRETYTGRWFISDMDSVEQAIVRIQARLDSGCVLSLNDIYNEFGLEKTMFGNTVGINPKLLPFVNDMMDISKVTDPEHGVYYRISIEPACYPCSMYRAV